MKHCISYTILALLLAVLVVAQEPDTSTVFPPTNVEDFLNNICKVTCYISIFGVDDEVIRDADPRMAAINWYKLGDTGSINICTQKVTAHDKDCPPTKDGTPNKVGVLSFPNAQKNTIILYSTPPEKIDLGKRITSVQEGTFWDEVTKGDHDLSTLKDFKLTMYRIPRGNKGESRVFIFVHRPII